jgi:hypothetical protein
VVPVLRGTAAPASLAQMRTGTVVTDLEASLLVLACLLVFAAGIVWIGRRFAMTWWRG